MAGCSNVWVSLYSAREENENCGVLYPAWTSQNQKESRLGLGSRKSFARLAGPKLNQQARQAKNWQNLTTNGPTGEESQFASPLGIISSSKLHDPGVTFFWE